MSLNQILPLVTTAIMFVFAALVVTRFLRRRSLSLLMWSIGLTLFGIGSFAEAFSLFGFNDLVFRLWYLCGAVLTAAWIGQGTIYLLLRRRWGNITLALLTLLSIGAAVLMFSTELRPQYFNTACPLSEQYATRELRAAETPSDCVTVISQDGKRLVAGIMPAGVPVRSITAIFNIYGSLALIGGALYSTYLFWRKRVLGNRVIGNILIAAGALSIASASTLTRLGLGGFLYVGELIAAVVMFVGFILASRRAAETRERELAPAAAQPAPSA